VAHHGDDPSHILKLMHNVRYRIARDLRRFSTGLSRNSAFNLLSNRIMRPHIKLVGALAQLECFLEVTRRCGWAADDYASVRNCVAQKF